MLRSQRGLFTVQTSDNHRFTFYVCACMYVRMFVWRVSDCLCGVTGVCVCVCFYVDVSVCVNVCLSGVCLCGVVYVCVDVNVCDV